MNATYKLKLEQQQRRLGLTHKELNKLDRKHNNINLIKYLQSLEPKVSVPVNNGTGFWGTFVISNQPGPGSSAKYMNVYFAYNNVALTSSQQINSNESKTFNITEANRLPLPGSTLQLKITMQSGVQSTDLNAYAGFEPQDLTNNPLDEENTLDILVNANNYDNGQCSGTFVITTPG